MNEIRYFLKLTKQAMEPLTADELRNTMANATEDSAPIRKVFVPTYIVTAMIV